MGNNQMATKKMTYYIQKLDNVKDCLALIDSVKFVGVSKKISGTEFIGWDKDSITHRITQSQYEFYAVIIDLMRYKRIELINIETKRSDQRKNL